MNDPKNLVANETLNAVFQNFKSMDLTVEEVAPSSMDTSQAVESGRRKGFAAWSWVCVRAAQVNSSNRVHNDTIMVSCGTNACT